MSNSSQIHPVINSSVTRMNETDSTGNNTGIYEGKDMSLSQVIEAQQDAEVELQAMGYTPALKRNRGMLAIQTMLISLFAVPFGVSSGFYTAIIGGGPVSLLWGFILVGVFEECVAISIGEIQSRYPTSGGPYYWSHVMAPPKFKHIISYGTGWLYMLAIWMFDLGTHYGTAILIISAVNIQYPDYVAPAWVLVLMTYALYAMSTFVTLKGSKYVPILDQVNSIFTLISLVVIAISLLVTHKEGFRSASFVFTHYDWSYSGWGQGWTFFIGLLPGAFVMCGVGFITAMSEEVAVPTIQIPRAMALGIPIAVVFGIVFILSMMFTLPDVAVLLAAPNGSPVPVILKAVTGSKAAGIVLLSTIISNAAIACVANQFVASRTTWAFSRDAATPYWQTWSHVDKNSEPRNALLISTLIQMLVQLISLGSSSAFNAFLNVGIIVVNLSYGLPIAINLYYKRAPVTGAPFDMGTIGLVCNIVALGWFALSLVLFCMPTAIPVTPTSANYAPVVLVFFMGGSAIWYAVRGRKTYRGPPDELVIVAAELAVERAT